MVLIILIIFYCLTLLGSGIFKGMCISEAFHRNVDFSDSELPSWWPYNKKELFLWRQISTYLCILSVIGMVIVCVCNKFFRIMFDITAPESIVMTFLIIICSVIIYIIAYKIASLCVTKRLQKMANKYKMNKKISITKLCF